MKLSLRRMSKVTAIALALLLGAAIAAQDAEKAPATIDPYGDWYLLREADYCLLQSDIYGSDIGFIIVRFAQDSSATILTEIEVASLRPEADAKLVIDGRSFPITRSVPNGGTFTRNVSAAFVEAFKAGNSLSIVVDGKSEKSASLSASARAYDAFAQCLEALDSNLPAAPPSLEYTRLGPPEPDLTPPFAPDRQVEALAPELWVQANDYPSRALRNEEEGSVNVEVIVGTNGRAKTCEIRETSGSDTLDRAACRNMMRYARWNPATDADGELIETVWRQAITWAIPGSEPVPTYYPPPPADQSDGKED